MAAVVVIRVVQRDGCGFEVTESGDDDRLPTAKPREEVAHLLLVALGPAFRHLQPEVAEAVQGVGVLRGLLDQLGYLPAGEP